MAEQRDFIFVCTGSDCKSAGCRTMLSELKELTKSPPYQGRLKIIKTKCMDFCKTGPMVIYKEEVIKKATVREMKRRFEE